MYKWHIYRILTVTFALLASINCTADIRCGLEFNGEPGFQEEELPLCGTADDATSICPLQRQECTIPMVWEEQQDGWIEGVCTEQQPLQPPNSPMWQCDVTGDYFAMPNYSICANNCRIPNMVMVQVPGEPECPAGSEYSCHEVAGTPMCSPNQCGDTEDTNAVENIDEETSEQTNDAVNADGECTGEYMFFPGTYTTCKLAGYSTRWDNCCNNGNKIITDAFNSPVDQATSTYGAVTGFLESVFGGSFVPPESVDKVLTASGVFIGTELVTDAMNWLITPCADESPQVAMIASGYCVMTGTYCSEKWDFAGCVQRKERHCCFNSMLAKIMHEQGRPQLGMGWANCNGFTVEQFQAIDFSKIDLSAYEAEIVRRSDAEISTMGTDASTRAITNYGP